MPDINSYAISLELTLRDQASEALRSMVNMANQVETKLKDVQIQLSNLETGSVNIGKNIVKSIKQIGAQDMSRINIANQGLDVAKQQQEITQKIQDTTDKYQDDLNKVEKKYQDKNIKFTKFSLRNMLRKIAGQKQTTKMTKQDIKDQQSQEGIIGRMARRILEARNNQKGFGKDAKKSISELDGSKVVLREMESGITTVKGAISGMFKGLGVGQLANLTSGWGLLKVGVQDAADMSEKFHTVNYRNVGTMNEMADVIIDFGTKGLPVLKDELIKSTIALREMGGTKGLIDGLRVETAEFGRISGVSADEIAKFAVRLTGVSNNIESTRGEMNLMNRMQKNLGLSGANVGAVMRNIGDETFFLGSSGSAAMGQYQKAMYMLAGSANKMGVDVGQTTKVIGDAVRNNAIEIDAIIQHDSKNFEDRMKYLSDYTKKWVNDYDEAIKADPSGKQAEIMFKQISKLYQKMGIAPDMGLLRSLADANTAGKDVSQVFADLDASARKELAGAADGARGLAREQQLTMDRIEANTQKMFKGIREQFESMFKWFNLDPINAEFAAMGLAGITATGMVVGGMLQVVSTIANVTIAMKLLGAASTGAGAAGGVAGAGIAAGFISAAIAVTGFLVVAAGLAYIAYDAVNTAKELRKIKDESDAIADSVRKANVKLEEQRKLMHTNYDDEINRLRNRKQALIDQKDEKSALETSWSTSWNIGLLYKSQREEQAALNKKELNDTEKQLQSLLRQRGDARKDNAIILREQQEVYKTAQKGANAHGMVVSRINEEAARLGVKTNDITSNQQRMAVVNRSILDDLREQTKQHGKQYTEQEMLTKLQEKKNELIKQGIPKTSVDEKALENLIKDINNEVNNMKPIQIPISAEVTNIINNKKLATMTTETAIKDKKLTEILKNIRTNESIDAAKVVSELSKTTMSTELSKEAVTIDEPKAELVPTTRLIEGSLRTDEHIDAVKEQSNGIQKMINSVDSIKDKINTGNDLELILKMMKKYLPEIAEGNRNGLSAIANQWQPT